MDINYLLAREQYALHLADTSLSTSARVAHRAFAKAYGALIAGIGFPHRDSNALGREPPTQSHAWNGEAHIRDWESEGGSIRTMSDQPLQRDNGNVVADDIALARGRVVTFA
ncbi:hypothetical protein [Sphingomonas sp. BAUL-RG-20F-R05-02]|uniref:hypothetical protein n=1 Tax=Sphingomonas sp. BAUL-RG-20F-R05-02 TaxID=2914830 RepID=UPI001F5A9455|nr:hypothetical protein [Sphingomonas sp. BAUL-RG-20F-R05-02]